MIPLFEKVMQYLKRNWQVLNSRAFDIEDRVNSAEILPGKKKRKKEVEDWLNEVEKLKPTIDALEAKGSCMRLPLREDPVGKLHYQIKELIEQSNHFNRFVLDAFDNIWEPTKLFGGKTKQNLERILPCLVTDDISNIGIHGIGGVGKTALAKHIKFHLLEKKYQVFWVTVSQEFSINGLQDKIANVLGVCLSDKDEEEVRSNILHGAMRKMGKFVLILDNVWDEFSVESIGISLGASKCRLILTTRLLEVCNRMGCQRIFEVNTLDTNESWDLFKYALCLRSMELPAGIEEIAKSVTRRCGGLPLGIITVAGSMRGVRDISEWRNTLEQLKACSEGHDEMGSDLFPILEWSYSRLNDCQRHCFLYCCLYPENEEISREELINIFICAEIMDRRSTRNLEIDQGHEILNHLIRVCLLEETKDRFTGNKCVKMHDLIRDMALRITSGKNSLETTKDAPRFLVDIVEGYRFSKIKSELKEEWREDLSAVSINLFLHGIPMDMSPNCPNLSTLLFHQRFSFYQKDIPSSFFNQIRGLKVLKLEVPFIKQLPDIISDMVNLAALLLSGCSKLASVPPLGKLSQLRILDLSRTEIEDIAEGLERLFNLELICLDHTKLKGIPKGTLSELRSLQQLLLGDKVVVDNPEVLNQLEVFYGCLSSVDVYNQHLNFGRLKCFRIQVIEDFDRHRGLFEFEDGKENSLKFSCCNFLGGSNVGRVCLLPHDIKELRLNSCIGMDKCISDVFPTLSSSNKLSYLSIVESAEVEFLLKLSSFPLDEPVMSPCGPFQKLEVLHLRDLPNFIELFNWDSKVLHRHLPPGTFSSLMKLKIWGCKKMRKLFTVQLLQNLQNLRTLYVSNCEELEEIAADDIEVGNGGGCIQSTLGGATNTFILPKLHWLFLQNLPKLKNICKGTLQIVWVTIKRIGLINCPEVKRLPLLLPIINGQPSPPNTRFVIRGTKKWWESLEWDNPNSKNALDPFFREEEEKYWEEEEEEDDDDDEDGEEDWVTSETSFSYERISSGKLWNPRNKKWWESLEWDNPNSKDALDPFFREYRKRRRRRWRRRLGHLIDQNLGNWETRGKYVK